MIKTITIDGNTSVKIKQSPHDMDRFCCVENHSEADMFASCTDSQCTENADGVARISAGGYKIIDTESYETLYLRGSGEVELTTSAYIGALARSFNRAAKGGDSGGGNIIGEIILTGNFAETIIGQITQEE